MHKNKNKIAVIIPVYKPQMTDTEKRSFLQCLSILKTRPIYLVFPKGLNSELYDNLANNLNTKLNKKAFPAHFFKNIKWYNNLMLYLKFYRTFRQYQFLLIYQLDAWIFRDDLDYWAKKDFDYIGAPWFENFGDQSDKIIGIGNGGFSLRRTQSFISALKNYIKQFNFNQAKTLAQKHSTLLAKSKFWLNFILLKTGLSNKSYILFSPYINEDYTWSFILGQKHNLIKIASISDAIKFSFEKRPSHLYKLNNWKLPTGCHGWNKYEPDFWKKFIQ